MASWIKRKKVEAADAVIIKRLFDEYFPTIYKWCYTSLNFVFDMLQVNIVQQVLCLLEGLLPSMRREAEEDPEAQSQVRLLKARPSVARNNDDDSEDDDEREKEDSDAKEEVVDTNATAHEQIFIFCLMWSLGAFLEDYDRSRFETYMRKHTKVGTW